jgi:hypothetical protein
MAIVTCLLSSGSQNNSFNCGAHCLKAPNKLNYFRMTEANFDIDFSDADESVFDDSVADPNYSGIYWIKI